MVLMCWPNHSATATAMPLHCHCHHHLLKSLEYRTHHHHHHTTMSPSEELLDEIEALNSIYGDGTLTPSPSPEDPNIYILVLPPPDDDTAASDPSNDNPSESSNRLSLRLSLRLSFPPSYPASEPPVVLATHSAGANAKPGAAAHALALFRQSVLATFSPGTVCLFDALEGFRARASSSESSRGPGSETATADEGREEDDHNDDNDDDDDPSSLGPSPPWTLSDPYTELRSTFLARAAPAASPAQASAYVSHLLATDRRARAATHNITAWRIRARGPDGTPAGATFQDCDDDGETAAGGRVLRLLQLMDAWDVVVVVTRWYGGQKLGPRRFAVINSVAREAVVRLLGEGVGGKAGGGGGGGGESGGKKKGRTTEPQNHRTTEPQATDAFPPSDARINHSIDQVHFFFR
ncbi:UPF0029-domain-containing protein [Sodiomyces alkalinus F11]|uniref:UPF0029-domain-containing protein n=1 Tax=Sodiomyces alkalinus (strain CBS 110278 / VKM F-3762 / F11) TaxID=1314773 RepID=A0A3N2PXS2_SODAK|nr:UPF0029-domain-containing protein [Sodiomyces alkalinus F11]ROT39321.1 UPF0029-domain-containing protein [Sodiomyces alkalinus F11]